MSIARFRSFGITIRPRLGIAIGGVLESTLLKSIHKLDYFSYCFEKEGEARHVHIQLWFDEMKAKGDVKRIFERVCESKITDWDNDQKRRCMCIKICYNNWIEEYCTENDLKDNNENLKFFKPPLLEKDYYASEEDQIKLREKANAVDSRFHSLLVLWRNHPLFKENPKIWDISEFYYNQMFTEKTIVVVIDPKCQRNIISALYSYITGYKSPGDGLTEDDKAVWIHMKEK